LFGVQQNTQHQNSSGIGLGLHVCKLITNAFDGEIFVHSRKNVGSLFTFSFKIDASESDQSQWLPLYKAPPVLKAQDLELLEQHNSLIGTPKASGMRKVESEADPASSLRRNRKQEILSFSHRPFSERHGS